MEAKQMIMSVSKIFNWTEISKSKQFRLSIYSTSTGQLIIQRDIKAIITGGMVHLNCNLKIGYTADDHQIFLQLRYGSQLVGQFKLDLRILDQKKFQYFPFGQRDKVLQINLLEEENNNKLKDVGFQKSNFIKERQSFLHNIQDKHKKLKRDFSEKVTRLMNEIKSVRNSGSKYQQNRFAYPYDQRQIYRSNKGRNTLKFEDTDSTNRRQTYNQYYDRQRGRRQTSSDKPFYARKEDQEKSEGKSSISSNKKLMLNTLDIVPSQQYFQYKKKNSKMPDLLPIKSKNQIQMQKRPTTPPRQTKKQINTLQKQYIQNFLNL